MTFKEYYYSDAKFGAIDMFVLGNMYSEYVLKNQHLIQPKRESTKIDAELLEIAMRFALNAHGGVRRKGNGMPYIVHPLRVMLRLQKYKKSTNVWLLMIVFVLHDVVEDCPWATMELIARIFGYTVASILFELTTVEEECERMGKVAYLIDKMNLMSSYAFLGKLIDRLDNVSDMDELNESARNRTIYQTKEILRGLDRKITKTHQMVIDDINLELSKWELAVS